VVSENEATFGKYGSQKFEEIFIYWLQRIRKNEIKFEIVTARVESILIRKYSTLLRASKLPK